MIELTTSALLLLSIFYGPSTANAASLKPQPPAKETSTENPTIVDGMALAASYDDANKAVETVTREYFKSTPILADIAGCESQFRHLGDNGEPIRGIANKDDIGVMQINEYYHADEAKKLGIDLKTLSGNMAYAKVLYDKFGTSPWQSSSECWNKFVSIAKG